MNGCNSFTRRMKRLRWAAIWLLFLIFPLRAEEIAATLDWARRVELGTTLSGRVSAVEVAPGQQVRKGERLLRLDQRGFQARQEEAQAVLEEARKNRTEAQRELDRALELYQRTVLADRDRQVAEIAAARAEAAYQKGVAALVMARLDLEYSEITAPFDGVVISVLTAPGEVVNSRIYSQVLVVVAENQRMLARSRVTGARASALRPGSAVSVALDDHLVEGTIHSVGLEPTGKSSDGPLYETQVLFTVPPGLPLQAGRRVKVNFSD